MILGHALVNYCLCSRFTALLKETLLNRLSETNLSLFKQRREYAPFAYEFFKGF